MKRFPALLLCLLLAPLSGCEPEEKPPIVVSATTSSETASAPASSSEAASSEPTSSAVESPPPTEAALITSYRPFATDVAIDEPVPAGEIDADLQQRLAAGEILPLDSGVCLDLDGDGKGEVIQFDIVQDEEFPDAELLQLTVGNRRITLESLNPTGKLYAAQLSHPGKIQLLASEDGPSSDPYTYFFEYEKGGLWHTGGVEGHPEGFARTAGGFTSSTRGKSLQTWYYAQEYTISNGEALSATEGQYVPSCVTPVPQGCYPMGTIVRLKEQLPLLTAPDADSGESCILPFNKLAALSASDDAEWVYVTTVEPSPQGGWLRLKPSDPFTCIVRDTEYSSASLFDGLLLVD